MSALGAPRRAVVLVGNPAAPYSRGLRIARTLVDAGFAVEIAAVTGEGLADSDTDGAVTIHRYRPSGSFASMAATYRTDARSSSSPRGPMPVRVARRAGAAARRWAFWPHTVRGWWATLERELEPAELYHACGTLTIAPALAARDRDRRSGRISHVIYDAVDDVVAGNNMMGMPSPVRTILGAREARWAKGADARITVNDALAPRLAVRWGVEAPIVVPNWPATTLAPDVQPADLIRAKLGLPPTTRIVVFQGRLGPNLGLDEAAEAILEVPDALLCLIGFGRGFAASLARDVDPRYAGHHATLPAVHPDELLAWTGSADVALVPLPPVSANQRASTPNKFWEAIAAGTPLVIGPGLGAMAEIVDALDLGVIADSLSPRDLGAAVQRVLDVEPAQAAERRRRIAAIARERFSWPVAAGRYRALVESLTAPGSGSTTP